MLVIEPTNGRELPHWSQMHWTAVEAHVRHLQGRIYRAATHEDHAQVKNLQKLLVRSMSAQLKAIRQVPQEHSGKHTPGIDGVVCDTPPEAPGAVARWSPPQRLPPQAGHTVLQTPK
jgi:RNA-directed DNA polymerase